MATWNRNNVQAGELVVSSALEMWTKLPSTGPPRPGQELEAEHSWEESTDPSSIGAVGAASRALHVDVNMQL